MTTDELTWIVVADGARARVFEERRRHARLHEVETMGMRLSSEDRPRAAHVGGTVHERGGPGRHNAFEHSPAEEAESRFLKRVAAEIDRAAQARKFEALVLIAPPRALGELRDVLEPSTRRLVRYEEPKDRVRENAHELHLRLRDLRTSA